MPTLTPTRRDELATLIRAHQAGVWRYLRFLGASDSLADDLTQETFLSVAREPDVDSGNRPAAYLRSVARNLFLNHLRREKRKLDFDPALFESAWLALTPEDDTDERLEHLRACLERLGERGRRAVDLEYGRGLKLAEIARELATTEDAVKALLKRARAELRECVERRLKDTP